jgi:hypothetical protein
MVLERELGKMQLYMNWVCKGIMDCNGCENIKRYWISYGDMWCGWRPK